MKSRSEMSEQPVPADFPEHMLDLDEDEDLEVFSQNMSVADRGAMPNSPGSMVNHYQLEEEAPVGGKDLFITVDNPESHVTAIETFITYRVLTQTTRSEFDSSEYQIRRRYQDFLWLRSKLEESHPTLIIHPLPEKFVMKGMVERFNDDFIETRKKALHRFLNKMAEHPILSSSPHLKVFLTAEDLMAYRKQGPSFLSRMGETVRAVANSVRGVRTRPEEFTAMQEYVEDFGNKVASVDRVTQRIIKEQKEYLDELQQYSNTYTQWAGTEEQLKEQLKGVAGCIEECGKETKEQIHHLSDVLIPTLHEYGLCTETVKAVMRRRDNIQAEFEMKNEALASKKVDQDALQQEVDGLADRVEQANNVLRGDWTRWQNCMRSELKSAFVATAEKNVDYYEKCLAVWETFLMSQRAEPGKQ